MNEFAPVATLTLSGLCIARPDGAPLLRDASLRLEPGETVLLVGPIGSGKSTLLRLLAGLIANGQAGWRVAGRLQLAGRSIDLTQESVAAGAMVFQDHALFDDLTSGENLAIAASHAEVQSASTAALASALTKDIGLDRSISALSGGQRQLVAVARTLLADPPVLLFDEPNAGLDPGHTVRLVATIEAIRRKTQRPLLITAHHVEHLLPVATRVLFLDPQTRTLVPLEKDAAAIEARLRQGAQGPDAPHPTADADDRVEIAAGEPARPRSWTYWQAHFFARYLWQLCLAPAALLYMALGAVLVGFVSTWFTFRHFPLSAYLSPLFHEELLAGIGFAQFRILVPLIAAILLAARSAAIIAADLGHRVHGRQIDAMRNLRIPVTAYLTLNTMAAMLVSALVLLAFMFTISAWVSLQTWATLYPDGSRHFWQEQFYAEVWPGGGGLPVGLGWVLAKTTLSALSIGAVAILLGRAPKASVLDLNRGIALAIVAALALVLMVHTAIAFLEF